MGCPPAELAHLYRQCTVGLIPYVVNDYTQGVSPLKTYEYLAAGLCVVSTGVPSVSPVAGDVVVSERHMLSPTSSQPCPPELLMGTQQQTPTERRRRQGRRIAAPGRSPAAFPGFLPSPAAGISIA